MPLKLPLLFSMLALIVSGSAALKVPSPSSHSSPLDLIKDTNVSLQAYPGHSPDLTFSPWPARPYRIPLHSHTGIAELVISLAASFHSRRPVSVPRLQEFLQDFCDNIESEYPIPGYVPRQAKQYNIDLDSYTEWLIDINEGLFGYRLPTEWALLALDELARQLGSHGPANMFFSIIKEGRTYNYGFLIIKEFGGPSLDASLTNTKSIFQTSRSQ